MNLDDFLIPRGHHSTVVADVPELGPVAFLLWGTVTTSCLCLSHN